MRILLDTNIFLDILLDRKPFADESLESLKRMIKNGDKMFFSSSSITDVYYVIRRQTKNKSVALDSIKKIVELTHLAEVNSASISKAIDSKINDFEDAVLDAIAEQIKATLILTRNKEDFYSSSLLCLTPHEFLNLNTISLE